MHRSRTTKGEPCEARSRIAPVAGQRSRPELVERTVAVLDELRRRRPRVHCITNAVAQTFSANMLLAAGAVPSMTVDPREIGDFVAAADALLVNLGTLNSQRRDAIASALDTAAGNAVPWLLDPVFVERSPKRAAYARALLAKAPAGVRLNGAEFRSLAAAGGDGEQDVAHYARTAGTVVAVTGEVDFVTDGACGARIANGHALMARVTAMGCAGSALVAACLAVEKDAFVAVAAALTAFGVAGEIAGERVHGPGSFAAAILDAVYALDAVSLRARARVG